MTIADMLMQKGHAKGLGRAERRGSPRPRGRSGQGSRGGRVATLRALLRLKFQSLDAAAEARLRAASPAAIDRYLRRLLSAETLAAVFDDRHRGRQRARAELLCAAGLGTDIGSAPSIASFGSSSGCSPQGPRPWRRSRPEAGRFAAPASGAIIDAYRGPGTRSPRSAGWGVPGDAARADGASRAPRMSRPASMRRLCLKSSEVRAHASMRHVFVGGRTDRP